MSYLMVALGLFSVIPGMISAAPGYGLLFGVIACPVMIFVGRTLFRVRLSRDSSSPYDATPEPPRTTLDKIGVVLVYIFLLLGALMCVTVTAIVMFFIICLASGAKLH
jgi:hypothetical protein